MSTEANRQNEPGGGLRAPDDMPVGYPNVSDCVGYLQELRVIVDDLLDRSLRFSSDCPKRLADATRYSLLAPGKRLRPTLALVAFEAFFGTDIKDIAPVCVALEAVHAYSLIHDDLPAMDDDDLRRGRPTCHRQFDEATAILAGDALLTFAFEILSKEINDAEKASKATQILSCAAGATGMVGGQMDDVFWSATSKDGVYPRELIDEALSSAEKEEVAETLSETDDSCNLGLPLLLKKIHRRKTGALFGAAVELGALMGGASIAQRSFMKNYGLNLGLAFQIADDLLDVVGDAATVGKGVHKDDDANKLTFPSLYGVEATRKRLAAVVALAKKPLLEKADFFERRPRAFNTLLYLVDFAAGREK